MRGVIADLMDSSNNQRLEPSVSFFSQRMSVSGAVITRRFHLLMDKSATIMLAVKLLASSRGLLISLLAFTEV